MQGRRIALTLLTVSEIRKVFLPAAAGSDGLARFTKFDVLGFS